MSPELTSSTTCATPSPGCHDDAEAASLVSDLEVYGVPRDHINVEASQDPVERHEARSFFQKDPLDRVARAEREHLLARRFDEAGGHAGTVGPGGSH